MTTLAHYEGYIIDLNPDTVWARMADRPGTDCEMEFPRHQFPQDEQPSLRLGTYVEMIVKDGCSPIVRKMDVGVWTEEDLAQAEKQAKELCAKLKIE